MGSTIPDSNEESRGLALQDDPESTDAEQAREAEALADSIPQLVWMARADGWIYWYNRRWYEYTGTTPEQMAGWGWQSVHDATFLPQVMEQWQRSIETGQAFEMEFPLRPADGKFRWFLTRVAPFRSEAGKVARWYGTNTDITAIKESEQLFRESEARLRNSEDKLRLALDTGNLGVWDWDVEADQLIWSDRCKAIFDVAPETVMSHEVFLKSIHPDDRAGIDLAVQQALQTRTDYNEVMRVPWSDGSVHWVLSVGRALYDAEGKPIRMSGVAHDITERQRVEERVRQAQRLESLGLLAGGVAHDFNNLLTGIMGGASVALEMLDPHSPLHPLLNNVLLSSERAAELTRQMLAYSGKGEFLIELVDLTREVRKTMPLVEHFVSKKVRVQLNLAEGLPAIEADTSQIQQVVMNLLTNAGEAIGDKDGVIEVSTALEPMLEVSRPGALKWTPSSRGPFVAIRVRDTGCGMDEHTQAKIFDPFFTTKTTGRGLGLAAILGIVRGHKGAIQVRSQPGYGTLFEVFFPPAASNRSTFANPVSDALKDTEPVSAHHTILVVDDEAAVHSVARAMLERRGYQVLEASGGEQAIDMLKGNAARVSLIILDVSMPGLSGRELLPLIRRIAPEIKIVMSSGFSSSDVVRQFEEERISGTLPKPYNAAQLVDMVSSLL